MPLKFVYYFNYSKTQNDKTNVYKTISYLVNFLNFENHSCPS